MPGILAMASRGAEGASGSREGESKKRSFDGKLVNGERNTPRTDAPAGDPATNGAVSAPSVNGISMPVPTAAMPVADQMAQLPPELEQLSSEHYHPLGKLMLRIGQECFNDLSEVLQKMADLPSNLQANGGMINGHSMANGGQDNTELSKQKKLLLLQFAQVNRAKFIKLLVLAEWGKRASADVAKCIDLFMWEREQSTAMDSVDDTIHWLKMWSAHARQSNPDIRTALEILATKKAEWIPDLGYIPPETTSSEKALKLLRYMNTSLSIRLTVHEDLPRQMQKWRVESGRATFVVDDEFELDLLSFVEDTSEQWHFIDLRLLFSPAPNITLGSRFQFELKMQLDKILRENGLRMCFDYLHNFILTHKINVLRSQAYELVRTGWTGSLKVEPVHRGLVIQYWIDKAGKKNWIEIGISTNKPMNGKASWRGPPIPSLAVRWFRHGVEVKDANLNFDWNNVSMERMLKHVIARHIVHLLRTTHQNLNPAMAIKATFSETEPSECMLGASMGSANATTLSVEPVTGKYILQPITPLSSSAENIINRPQEVSNTGAIITQLLARSIIDRVQRIAQQVGWQQIKRQSLRLDVMKAAVGLEVLQYVLYWPRGWTPTWALAAVVDASGETWWICEIGSTGSTVESARQIAIEKLEGHSPPINRTTLCGIGRIAVHTLAYHVTTRELEKRGKAFSLGDEFAQCRHHSASRGVVRGWVLHLKTADLLALKPDEPPWLEPGMRVMCQGLRSDSRNIWHIASGTMLPDAAADMKKLMSASPQKNFSFSEGGHFHILLCTPFGEEVVSELKARLRDLDRLRSFAATLQKRKMPLRSSSLQQVQFQYGQHLTATVKFDEGDDVKVHFGNNNPHKRIEGFLADMVNEKTTATEHLPLDGSPGLDRFCTTLLVTRPLLSMLDAIANQQPGNYRNPAIHAHAISTYRITYNNPICSFDIRLRPKEDKVFWLVEDNEGKPPDFRPKDERTPNFKRQETLKNALQKLYKESGERWYGVRSGIVADIDGIPGALKRLHETVLSCSAEDDVKQELSNGSAPAGTTPGQPSNKGPGPKPSGGGAPNGKMPPGKINAVGGKPAVGVKREVITID